MDGSKDRFEDNNCTLTTLTNLRSILKVASEKGYFNAGKINFK